ncbi:MAG: serine/threonine protein kinase [Desulfurivibrionaceae bacterium]|nr:serine/threonine protein kinase [Desulfobulbales bacterium]MDT8334475.1 serine/threonine protein kinase [Desulfurivibrionaceae bacterium]
MINNKNRLSGFLELTPETIITLAEQALAKRFSGICRPLNSYINRVYELEAGDGAGIIIKFYRPTRWSRRALLDEHDFLLELSAAEVPVITPLQIDNGATLGTFKNISYALFPKKSGRFVSEYNDEQWLELGRLLARTHAVGALKTPGDRGRIHPHAITAAQLDFLEDNNFVPPELAGSFFEIGRTLIEEIAPLFEGAEMIRIHGDCHFSNIIYRPDESFYLIDFDDFGVGPPVHDLWMLLPDRPNRARHEINLFMEGYETFRPFPRRSLTLIEPLRAMRYIHFIAWCAHQVIDGGEPPTPDWGTLAYWTTETRDLKEQLARIREEVRGE